MKNFFKKILHAVISVFQQHKEEPLETERAGPPISFTGVTKVSKTPDDSTVRNHEFLSVVFNDKHYWSIFQCPCGCGEVISLPMSEPHNPKWRLSGSINMPPSLSPSVWRNRGCMSHFWIKKGRVHWCGNTGTPPWVARPDIYKKPDHT